MSKSRQYLLLIVLLASVTACTSNKPTATILQIDNKITLSGELIAYTRSTSPFFGRGYDINVRSLTDGRFGRFTTHETDEWFPAWSPDGSQIAYKSNRDGTTQIYVQAVDGSDARGVTPGTGLVVNGTPPNVENPSLPRPPEALGIDQLGAAGGVTWSADGTRLAFSAFSFERSDSEIFVINLDGTGAFNLTNTFGEDGAPSWSPDGNNIAFHSNRGGGWDIYKMNADGSNVVQLTTFGFGLYPSWSPDGSQLVFIASELGPVQCGHVYIMNANGTNQHKLQQDQHCSSTPIWSHDGSRIMFSQYGHANYGLLIMDANGENADNYIGDGSNAGYFKLASWSPPGLSVIVTASDYGP